MEVPLKAMTCLMAQVIDAVLASGDDGAFFADDVPIRTCHGQAVWRDRDARNAGAQRMHVFARLPVDLGRFHDPFVFAQRLKVFEINCGWFDHGAVTGHQSGTDKQHQ